MDWTTAILTMKKNDTYSPDWWEALEVIERAVGCDDREWIYTGFWNGDETVDQVKRDWAEETQRRADLQP
jgi:hypothetical protein